MAEQCGNILLPSEIEFFISRMDESKIEDVGTIVWIDWHKRLQRLNQQAVIEASELREECVKDLLVSYNKVSVLVHEAILMSVWRSKIMPKLLKIQPKPENTFLFYSALYQEAIAVGLLELVLYHSDSCDLLQDFSLDLLDYAYDSITALISLKPQLTKQDEIRTELAALTENDLPEQRDRLLYDIGMCCISILFHLIVNINQLQISTLSRILTTLDVPLLLVQLIEEKPWAKEISNKTYYYKSGKWQSASEENEKKLMDHEAHVWLSLRQLMLDSKTFSMYEFTPFRKSQLMRLQKYLTDVLLDQIPPLMDLKYWLAQAAFSDPPVQKKSLIIELVPEIKERILSNISKKMKKIVNEQAARFLTTDKDKLQKIATSLSEAYSDGILERMEQINDGQCANTCDGCGKRGLKKCSNCQNAWYCGRQCQVGHWPQHKEKCTPSN